MRPADFSKGQVAASFSRAAQQYDAHAELQRQVADRLLLSIDRERPVQRILDLGSGTGYASQALRAAFPQAELISLDIAPGMLHFARQARQLPGHFLCGDAEALPLKQGAVDLVFSSLAVQWCQDCEQLFSEICRVARPGAQCLLSTLLPGTLRELAQAWAQVDDAVHVNAFTPTHALYAALNRQVVADLDFREVASPRYYPDLGALARELKAIGAHNMNARQPRGLTGKGRLQRLQKAFMAGAGVQGRAVSWQVGYLEFTVGTSGE